MASPAKPAGKKKADIDDIMAVDDIKSIISRARRGTSANCLIGATADDEAVIYLDRKKSPKQLVGVVMRAAADAGIGLNRTSLRYGRISFKTADGEDVAENDGGDADDTGRILHIIVNKEPLGSLPMKLRDRLKKAGCSKFEIHVDTGLEQESDDGPAAAPAAPAAAPAAAQPSATDAVAPPQPSDADQPDAAQPAAAAAPQSPSDPAAAPDQAGAAAMAPISARLIDLLKQLPAIVQSAPAQKASIVQLATAASAAVKSGDSDAAGKAVDALAAAAEAAESAPANDQSGGPAPAQSGAPASAPAAAAAVPAATLTKSRAIWVATRGAVEKQLDALQGKMAEVYQDHDFGAHLEKVFRDKVEPVLGTLDDSLVHILDEAGKTQDAAAQKKLINDAQDVISKYESYLAKEKLIQQLDQNPFMELKIEATLTKTLEALGRTLSNANSSLAA